MSWSTSARTTLAAVLLLTLAACGEEAKEAKEKPSRSDSSMKKAEKTIAHGLRKTSDFGPGVDPVVAKAEAECMAQIIVKQVGVDNLVEANILRSNGKYDDAGTLEEPEARIVVDATDECIGAHEYWFRLTKAANQYFTGMSEGGKVISEREWKKSWPCFRGVATVTQVKENAVYQLTGGEAGRELPPSVKKKLDRCDKG